MGRPPPQSFLGDHSPVPSPYVSAPVQHSPQSIIPYYALECLFKVSEIDEDFLVVLHASSIICLIVKSW